VGYPLFLFSLLAAVFAVLAIDPVERQTWALENTVFAAGLAFVLATRRRAPLSNTAYTLLFVFFVLHEVGAHYTYSLVPYDVWAERFFGQPLSIGRNHYDRFVHLCFGLFCAPAVRELLVAAVKVGERSSYWLAVAVCMSWSVLYEIVEWLAALVFGGETALAYVGTQGDVWDAQKDMGLALSGAVTAMLASALVERVRLSARAGRLLAPRPRRRWRALRGLPTTSPSR
jgi:putative membrane protein